MRQTSKQASTPSPKKEIGKFHVRYDEAEEMANLCKHASQHNAT